MRCVNRRRLMTSASSRLATAEAGSSLRGPWRSRRTGHRQGLKRYRYHYHYRCRCGHCHRHAGHGHVRRRGARGCRKLLAVLPTAAGVVPATRAGAEVPATAVGDIIVVAFGFLVPLRPVAAIAAFARLAAMRRKCCCAAMMMRL